MADAIESETEPVRALFVVSGNPILAIGGEERLRRAFDKLELIVSVDLYRGATGELADYALPATDGFERHDLNLCGLGLQAQPFVQVVDPVVEPRGERKPEWWIFGRLEQALGMKSLLDAGDAPPLFSRLDHMLRDTGMTADEIKTRPSGTIVLDPNEPGRFFEDVIQIEDGRVDCDPALFHIEGAIERMETIFEELSGESADMFKLITKREPSMHNSWMQNLAKVRGRNREPRLWLHPHDAARVGVAAGDRVRVRNEWGEIEVAVALENGLALGVAALPHGAGNGRTPALQFASEQPGANANRLLPSGTGSFEPLSGQAFMTGVPIEIERAGAND